VSARYGVFLRPDPLTCAAVTRITDQLRAQYGLLSAGAFPPHATLAGSLALGHRVDAFTAALDELLAAAEPFAVHNAGIARPGGLVFDIHSEGPLVELAARVDAVSRPFLAPVPDEQLPPDVHPEGEWVAHLSLASHDYEARGDWGDEVEAYVRALAVPYPEQFTADTVALYRFEHPTWTGAWWRDLRWEWVRGWRLGRSADVRDQAAGALQQDAEL
jgi:2'-5' RNA ligase superfamily